MKTIKVSGGVRFGTEKQEALERKRNLKNRLKVDKDYLNFVEQCNAYGLPTDFYMAIAIPSLNYSCLENNELLYLRGFDGDMAILLDESGIEFTSNFENVLTSLRNGLLYEAAILKEKLEDDVYDLSIEDDMNIVKKIRLDLKNKECILKAAEKMFNPNMQQVSSQMRIPQNAGCKYYGVIHEFVSYRPDNINTPYVIENIEKDFYDSTRYKFVDFNTLLKAVKDFSSELEANEAQQWLNMAENIIPYDNGGKNIFSDSDGQQTFFVF